MGAGHGALVLVLVVLLHNHQKRNGLAPSTNLTPARSRFPRSQRDWLGTSERHWGARFVRLR